MALESSENWLDYIRALGDHSQIIGMYVYQNNTFVYINQHLATIFQDSRENLLDNPQLLEILGLPEHYHHESELDIPSSPTHQLSSADCSFFEHTSKTKNGQTIYLKTSIFEIIQNGTRSLLGTVVDTSINDTSVSARTIASLQKSKNSLALAQAVANIGNWEFDVSTRELSWSEGIYKILDVPIQTDTLSAAKLGSYIHPDDKPWVLRLIQETLDANTSYSTEYRIICPKGERIVHEHAQVIHDDQGVRLIGIVQDVTDKKQLEYKIKHLAYHDALTDLPNRTQCTEQLIRFIDHKPMDDGKIGIMFMDLDKFKRINDSLGHAAGDAVLLEVANRLRDTIGAEDMVSRWGGDEFVLLFPHIESQFTAEQIAQNIIETISQVFTLHDRDFYMTPSIGISLYPDDGTQPEMLINYADLAMYYAKAQVNKHYLFYSQDMSQTEDTRMTLEYDLRLAIERNELQVFYQPIVNAKTLEVVAAEALLRWHHPTMGTISPSVFIPLAEATGLITPIGDWVLNTVCRTRTMWLRSGHRQLRFAVNLSARQIEDEQFVDKMVNMCDPCRLHDHWLELEITESAVMKNEAETIAKLKQLKAMGMQISLDDFGTGYSSLNYLRIFSTDTLKIDQAFVRDITSKPEVASITQSLITMAHNLSMKVVAEGVETAEQLRLLQGYGCDEIQGYLFSRPIPAEQFERLFLDGGTPAE